MTYNVRRLRDDRAAVVEVLRAAAADVVAVQEPPRGPVGLRRLRRVASQAGLEVAVAGGGARTTALLTAPGLPVTGHRTVRLSWRPGRTRRGLSVLHVGGVRVISAHLGLVAAERATHVDRLLRVVASAVGPAVVAADLNEPPGGGSHGALLRRLRDLTIRSGPTYPSVRPAHRIDVVLATSELRATAVRVLDDDVARRAADHLPVVVDLELRHPRSPVHLGTAQDAAG